MTRTQALSSVSELKEMVRAGRPGIEDKLSQLENYFWSLTPPDPTSLGESARSVGIAAMRRQALEEGKTDGR
jgi:hypothetical protein